MLDKFEIHYRGETNIVLAIERHRVILKLLSENGQVTTNELCEKLSVSPATVRNDLNKLENDKLICKTHGGATLLTSRVDIPMANSVVSNTFSFKTRESKNGEEKQAISEYALQYIQDNQCILLDASSTALVLARKLDRFNKLTVITNGIYTMLALKEMPNITVIFIGGIVTKNSGSIEGLLGADILNHINADCGFISANGFTLNEGLTDFNVYEVELKKAMLKHCKRVVVMLDSLKFENISTTSFSASSNLDLVLTDEKIDKDLLDRYRKHGIHIEICPYNIRPE
jgi:DeoR/GlpR family transcriptional regulator of sugar metabolism